MRASTILALCLFAFGSIGRVSAATELKILSIDKDVKPATSAEDMAGKLHELGVGTYPQ